MELPSTRGAATCSKKVGNGNGLTDPRRKKLKYNVGPGSAGTKSMVMRETTMDENKNK
jgi:hypothetical protein